MTKKRVRDVVECRLLGEVLLFNSLEIEPTARWADGGTGQLEAWTEWPLLATVGLGDPTTWTALTIDPSGWVREFGLGLGW